MNVSLDISMYPLQREYEQPILNFIARLQTYPQLNVVPNALSTQVFGVYDELMPILQSEIRYAFGQDIPIVIVMKLVNMDRSDVLL
ncbi:MAG TPA: hypothetical protein PKD70_04650 [Saprospiraceae bacterium]|nr:hypothetical protein [Saprospiraceae bacterium]HMP13146.1 hypothetical protein [Saprospiraceae bacterium]